MKQLLKQLISFKTISEDAKANLDALRFCRKILNDKEISSKIYKVDGIPSLSWGCDLKEAKFMFNTHIDVVPGQDEVFEPKEQNDRLLGRGSLDAKSSVALLLSLNETIFSEASKKKIAFVIVCDEETGGESTKKLLSKMTRLEFAIFGEPTNLKIVNQAKGIMQVRITALGKTAHGSKLWRGDNAILILTRKLNSFLNEFPLPFQETHETTVNFAQIQGGSAINQVPDKCELLCDVRLNPFVSSQEVLNQLQKHFKGCKIEVIKNESAILTNKKNLFVAKFLESIKSNNLPCGLGFEFFSSDARHCTERGIPALVFGPKGENLHEDKEWLDLKSLEKCKNVIETFINET